MYVHSAGVCGIKGGVVLHHCTLRMRRVAAASNGQLLFGFAIFRVL